MDDIAAMVAEAIARRVKAAQAQAQAQATRVQAVQGSGVPATVANQARPTAAKPPVPMGATPQPVAAPAPLAAPAASDALRLDTLPGLPTSIFEAAQAPRPQLLQAFSGAGLLAGIVLSEALARPVALREGGSGTPF